MPVQTDVLYEVKPLVKAVARWLSTVLPAPAYGLSIPEDAAAPFLLVTTSSPTLDGTLWGGDVMARLPLRCYSIGKTLPQAMELGDQVRSAFLNRVMSGAFANEIVLADEHGQPLPVEVMDRERGEVLIEDVIASVPQAIEGFTITVQRA